MDKSGGGDSRDGGPSSSPAVAATAAAAAAGAAATSSSSSSSSPPGAAAPMLGCGSGSTSSNSSTTPPMTLNVTTTTGGSFSVAVDGENSVENLKKIISKKLKVSKDRICLLHRERELHDGTLRENGLMDGSKLILTPNVETGLLAQRAENTVMQALESLNDNQVNDFLSGKSPLNLSVRLGDHMMLIQLQLSTLNPSSQNGNRSKTHKARTVTAAAGTGGSSTSGAGASLIQAASAARSHTRTTIPIGFRRVTTVESTVPSSSSSSSSTRPATIVEHVGEAQTLTKQEIESIHSIVKNLAESDNPTVASVASPSIQEPMETELGSGAARAIVASAESPIKSLSNLVSSSISSNIPPTMCNNNTLLSGPSSPCTDPISANLTSCLCKRLDNNDNTSSCESNCLSRAPDPQQQPSTSSASLHRTAHNPIARHKTKIQTLKKNISFDSTTLAKTELETVQPIIASKSAPNSPQRIEQPHLLHSHHHHHHYHHHHHLHPSSATPQAQPAPGLVSQPGPSTAPSRALNTDPNGIENPALAEASRNLTQTLRKLSKRVFTNKVNDVSQETARNVSSGAVIESMKHHGKGIYSGTFSGTLNPALQDKFGRPKRDISTIIHILNDLLSAAPQCARSGTKIYFEPSAHQMPASNNVVAASTASSSTATGPGTMGPGSANSSSSISIGSSRSSNSTSSSSSNTSNNNLQASAVMAPTSAGSFTTPVVAPSPRLVSRCVPTVIQTKKYPSNGAANGAAGGGSIGQHLASVVVGPSGCIGCKSGEPSLASTSAAAGTTVGSFGRCHHHLHHLHHHHHHPHQQQQHQQQHQQQQQQKALIKLLCKCGLPLAPAAPSTGSPPPSSTSGNNPTQQQQQQQQCQRCAAISAAELENSKTKTKLDNLRLIMQQKKERREARKQKCAPYSTAGSATVMVAGAGGSGSPAEVVRASHLQQQLAPNTSSSGSAALETMDRASSDEPATTAAAAAAIVGETTLNAAASSSNTSTNTSNNNAATNSATATATATTTTTSATAAAASASSSEAAAAAAQSHQIVEEVDTVA